MPESKLCKGCGKLFYSNEIPQEKLRKKPFELYKRCNACRARTDIRHDTEYHKKRYAERKKKMLVNKAYDDRYFKIVIAILELSYGTLMRESTQRRLDKLLLSGVITLKDKVALKAHYKTIIFMLDFELDIPYHSAKAITDLDREVLRILFQSLLKSS